MLTGGGWSQDLLDCCVVCLAGHNRPTHEALFPNEKPIEAVFENEFVGMTSAPVGLDEQIATLQRLMHELHRALQPRHRQLLLSIVRAEPEWGLLPHAHLAQLPALRWNLHKLAKLKKNVDKFRQQHDELAGAAGACHLGVRRFNPRRGSVCASSVDVRPAYVPPGNSGQLAQ